MANVSGCAPKLGTSSSDLYADRSRLCRWGGLLAAVTSTDDFDTAMCDDPEIKQMIDTVQRLEASLRDCAVHGLQNLVNTFVACELTHAILNRWNSPVLDALWQALTGRTPDGVTPFLLNPPDNVTELLHRLVWPKSYLPAVDLVLEFMNVTDTTSSLLAPSIAWCACAGHVDILKRLLAHPLSPDACDYILNRLYKIALCAPLPCFELLLPHLSIESTVSDEYHPMATVLNTAAIAHNLELIKFLLCHYQFDGLLMIERAAGLAAGGDSSPNADATFELLFNSVQPPSELFSSIVLRPASLFNRVNVVRHVLALGRDEVACRDSVSAAMSACQSYGSDVLTLLLAQLSAEDRLELLQRNVYAPLDRFDLKTFDILLESVRDQPRPQLQTVLDRALLKCVSRARCDQAALCDQASRLLHHGAHARAADDCIIYLAALSGRADVMEVLLAATDVDTETALGYRQQMNQPSGLLGVAQQLRERNSALWFESELENAFSLSPADELCVAMSGNVFAALQWLLSLPTQYRLDSAWPLVEAVRAGNVALVRALFDPRSINELKANNVDWWQLISEGLRAARESQNFELIQLLFHLSLRKQRVSIGDIRKAIQANDPFTHRYLFGHYEPEPLKKQTPRNWQVKGVSTLMQACMTGNLTLLENVWLFVRAAFGSTPELFQCIEPRIDRALKLCTESDLSPVVMALMTAWSDMDPEYDPNSDHPIELAAKCGQLAAVKLWLAAGIPAQWALPAAMKHGHRELVSCLLAHGASSSGLSPAQTQLLQSLLQV